MKNMKKIFIAILAVILIMSGAYKIFASNCVYGDDKRGELEQNDGSTTEYFGYSDMEQGYDNVYCIEHGQSFGRKITFSKPTKVVIEGNIAKFYTYDDDTKTYSKLGKTVEHEANNILAAILTPEPLGRDGRFGEEYSHGYKMAKSNSSRPVYSDAQLGLYAFLNEWTDAVQATEYQFERQADNMMNAFSQEDRTYANQSVEYARDLATKYTFGVTLYLLKAGPSSHQSLISVYPDEPTKLPIEIPVEKIWEDNGYTEDRPNTITVKLLANDIDTGKTLELNAENGWKGKFTDLDEKDENGVKIQYTIQEIEVSGYKVGYTGDQEQGFTITNTIESIDLTVKKEWVDEDNKDKVRPTEIKVTLCENATPTNQTVILKQDSWVATFEKLPKYKQGQLVEYSVIEEIVEGYEEPEYQKTVDANGNVIYTIINTQEPSFDGYIEITGKVWVDGAAGKGNDINGTFGEEDSPLKGIKATLKDANGNQFDVTSTTYTDENGNYTIKVNYDNSQNVYKLYEDAETVGNKLKTAYVEFEYDGLKYTTVKNSNTGVNTSKAIEDENARTQFDNTHSNVTSSTLAPEQWTDKNITAKTKDVISFEEYIKSEQNMQITQRDEIIKYCNGNGTYTCTNRNGAWNDVQVKEHTCSECNNTGHSMETFSVDVGIIKNVNLGLFEREQPDVAIYSDLTKVQVVMNGQQYTYLYGVRSDKYKDSELQVKFQNKDTYTYKRPVNPADIAFIQQEANSNAMSVLVTYEVKVGNLSTTLPITVHNIKNTYDLEYTLNNEGWTVNAKEQFNEAISGELNITVEPQKESSAIELTYTVSLDAIKGLLNEEATLNNAVEIETYSTKYGAETLYAEQRVGGRTNQPYAGYDYNSHPGNAGLFINNEGRLEAAKPEDDTDIAPSFVLCKNDTPKTLSGTIWEDTDITENAERLGNGKYDNGELGVENVKVELYNLDGTLAKLYNKETKQLDRDAIVYTNGEGKYSLDGVVTGEYFIKYTYGDDTTKLGHEATTIDGTTTINARNYKSTIIPANTTMKNIISKAELSEDEKKWHITHENGYSIAVDNMKERTEISDLQYENFENSLNMSAYTKPFTTQVEFEATGQSQVKDESGDIGISTDLNKMDFGIIERPREDLFIQKTITYLKITLANNQILIEGDPRTDKLNYVKAMGFDQAINNSEQARNALEKQMLTEIDPELIQGATLEIKYEVTVTNHNEIDYDYGTLADYGDIVNNQYITSNPKANYYYYGDATGLNQLNSTIKFADYLNKEIVCEDASWKSINVDILHEENNKLISDETYHSVKDKGYQVYEISDETPITIERDESFRKEMYTKTVLANREKLVFDAHAEIIRIDGKTARTIKESDNGVQIKKLYKPGNYVPGLESGLFEQDDDRCVNRITSPTGITNYVTIYVIAALIGLSIIVIGVIFIKRKVLNK